MNASDAASEASAVGFNGQAQADANQLIQLQAPANANQSPPNLQEPDANHPHSDPAQADPNPSHSNLLQADAYQTRPNPPKANAYYPPPDYAHANVNHFPNSYNCVHQYTAGSRHRGSDIHDYSTVISISIYANPTEQTKHNKSGYPHRTHGNTRGQSFNRGQDYDPPLNNYTLNNPQYQPRHNSFPCVYDNCGNSNPSIPHRGYGHRGSRGPPSPHYNDTAPQPSTVTDHATAIQCRYCNGFYHIASPHSTKTGLARPRSDVGVLPNPSTSNYHGGLPIQPSMPTTSPQEQQIQLSNPFHPNLNEDGGQRQ
jgi:hypothetical protein